MSCHGSPVCIRRACFLIRLLIYRIWTTRSLAEHLRFFLGGGVGGRAAYALYMHAPQHAQGSAHRMLLREHFGKPIYIGCLCTQERWRLYTQVGFNSDGLVCMTTIV